MAETPPPFDPTHSLIFRGVERQQIWDAMLFTARGRLQDPKENKQKTAITAQTGEVWLAPSEEVTLSLLPLPDQTGWAVSIVQERKGLIQLPGTDIRRLILHDIAGSLPAAKRVQ